MQDFFALLGETRRPWLEAGALKEKYHRVTAEQHPDVAQGNGGDFAEINRAYRALSDPAARLRHLLELETGGTPAEGTQSVPAEIAAFFEPVGMARQRAAAFLKKQAAAGSPLAKALLTAEQCQVQEELERSIEDLGVARERVLTRVGDANALWDQDRKKALAALPELWQSLGYLDKWLAALREDLFRFAGL